MIESWTALSPHESEWQKLLTRSALNEPVMTPFWLNAWWRVFGAEGGRKLRMLLVFEDRRLIGVVPLLTRRHWYLPGLPFRRIELLGSGEEEADEICSEYLGVIAERGREPVVIAELTRALATGALGEWDEAVFAAMHAESPLTGLLVEGLERAHFDTRSTTTAECPFIALPESWDEYLRRLSSSSRSFVKRTLAAFQDWAGGEDAYFEVRSPLELARGTAVLRALHGERWSEASTGGVFGSPRFRAFHWEIMLPLLASGALELSWLAVRGEPIAALYNFSWNGKVYFYQSGRKLDVPSRVRPGIVAHLHAIRRAIERGRREYDFLGGASRYKLALATDRRSLVTVRAVHPSLLELARERAEHSLALVRSLRPATR
ncbi:MAG TPA: GNAT family N-acetyltransferase [Polyangiaceae bacterium]